MATDLVTMRSNPSKYSASSEKWWKDNIETMTSYKPFTTFYSDLSIAECYGHKAIKDTYNKVLKEWGKDIKYMTEFVMSLNYKIWQLYEIDYITAKLYNDLWYESKEFIYKHFKGDDLDYYYNVVD